MPQTFPTLSNNASLNDVIAAINQLARVRQQDIGASSNLPVVTTSAPGYVPAVPNNAAQFLNGASPPAFAAVTDANLSISDITTNNVSISAHGFCVKAPNDTTKFFRGDATWAALPSTSLSYFTNSLSGDVTMTNQNQYYDGPSVAQGTVGTWVAFGTVTITLTSSGNNLRAKLWDGTTVMASAELDTFNNATFIIALSGVIASPAGNIRISVENISNANAGAIKFNVTGNSKDSTVTAVRIV